MVILIIFNEFSICTSFLITVRNYFSRWACLHFIGNNPSIFVKKSVKNCIYSR